MDRQKLEKVLLIVVSGIISIFIMLTVSYTVYNWGTLTNVTEEGWAGEICVTPECLKAASEISAYLDTSFDPCQNFYQFACGGWIKTNPVPNGMDSLNTDDIVQKELNGIIQNLLEQLAHSNDPYLATAKNDYWVCTSVLKWEEIVCKTSTLIPFALAKIISNYFNKSVEQDVNEIVGRVEKALENLFVESDWLGNDKMGAIIKLWDMRKIIVYPKELEAFLEDKNPKSLQIAMNNLLSKNMSVGNWIAESTLVMAHYNLIYNRVCYTFPPFYSYGLPKHQNFGGLGATIGHEIGHAFGVDGIKSFHDLSPESQLEFEKRKSCLSNQYSSYKVNGTLTLDENISDNLGIRVAFNAYVKAVEEIGADEGLPGLEFTPKQLFFIKFGQSWCESITKKGLEEMLMESHPPEEVRVNGALRNFEEFSNAFNCPVKDEVDWMNPPQEKKCWVW